MPYMAVALLRTDPAQPHHESRHDLKPFFTFCTCFSSRTMGPTRPKSRVLPAFVKDGQRRSRCAIAICRRRTFQNSSSSGMKEKSRCCCAMKLAHTGGKIEPWKTYAALSGRFTTPSPYQTSLHRACVFRNLSAHMRICSRRSDNGSLWHIRDHDAVSRRDKHRTLEPRLKNWTPTSASPCADAVANVGLTSHRLATQVDVNDNTGPSPRKARNTVLYQMNLKARHRGRSVDNANAVNSASDKDG